MRAAIIDLGTNSVRFDAYELSANGRIEHLRREKLMIRLGEGVFASGKLEKSAVRRALQAFQKFSRICRELGISRVVAFGTAALRDARDARSFVALVREKTGISIRVISGDEEAKLIALGILSRQEPPKGLFALVDIGGGSTEISICLGKRIRRSKSLPLGAARLQQVFLRKAPPDPKRVRELREYVRRTVDRAARAGKWPKVQRIVASSGTARAIRKILRKSGCETIYRSGLRALAARLSRLDLAELRRIRGLELERADIILAGVIVLQECMKALGASRADTTDHALREGILAAETRTGPTRRRGKGPFGSRDSVRLNSRKPSSRPSRSPAAPGR